MKLSKIPTDRALDILCEITPHINAIVTDEELLAELKVVAEKDKPKTSAEYVAFGVKKINKIVPIILKKNRPAVYGILSALYGKTAEEIAKQDLLTTAAQIREAVADKDLIHFFKSCTNMEGGE